MWGPNLVGAIFGALQLILIAIFPSKKGASASQAAPADRGGVAPPAHARVLSFAASHLRQGNCLQTGRAMLACFARKRLRHRQRAPPRPPTHLPTHAHTHTHTEVALPVSNFSPGSQPGSEGGKGGGERPAPSNVESPPSSEGARSSGSSELECAPLRKSMPLSAPVSP